MWEAGIAPTTLGGRLASERRLHPGWDHHFFFAGGGGAAFTGAAFASFLGFFFSLLCELLPFPIAYTSVRDSSLGQMTANLMLLCQRGGKRLFV